MANQNGDALRPAQFTREDTRAIKGLAVVLMLLHHLAAFGDRWPVGFPGFQSLWRGFVEQGFITDLAFNAILCVPVFFFLGGVGLYRRWAAGRYSLTNAIVTLYKQFWKVFIIFIPIGYLLFCRTGDGINSLCTRWVVGDAKTFLRVLFANFTGYDTTLNGEWWFLGSYICTLPLGYLFCRAIRRHKNVWADIFLVFVIEILTQSVFPDLANMAALPSLGRSLYFVRFLKLNKYSTAFFMGVVWAKYDLLEKLKGRLLRVPLRGVACLAGCVAVFICRAYMVSNVLSADLVLVPFFVAFLSVLFDCVRPLKAGFRFLGGHSTNMWLVHSFYCFYFLEFTLIVYATRSVWIDLLILIALSLATSIVLDGLYDFLGEMWTRLRGRFVPRKDIAE